MTTFLCFLKADQSMEQAVLRNLLSGLFVRSIDLRISFVIQGLNFLRIRKVFQGA